MSLTDINPTRDGGGDSDALLIQDVTDSENEPAVEVHMDRSGADASVVNDVTDKKQETDSTKESVEASEYRIPVPYHGQVYQKVFSDYEFTMIMSLLIDPKPTPETAQKAVTTAKHRNSVCALGSFLGNAVFQQLAHHDEFRLFQTEEEHHEDEVHHWPYGSVDPDEHLIDAIAVIEAACDGVATIIGRCSAGRGPPDYLEPTIQFAAADIYNATVIRLLDALPVGHWEPEPPPYPGIKRR